jgi:hypothetical protein
LENFRLENMVKGWFIGSFKPNVLQTDACEVAVKRYQKGEYEKSHLHKQATEITVIIEGVVSMCGREWRAGDILKIFPGEATDFLAITDAVTVVVKCPGVINDKFFVE